MLSAVIKRSVAVNGRKTSVTLEEEFWQGLHEIAFVRCMPLSDLVNEIELNRRYANLSSQIRTFVLDYFRSQAPSPILAREIVIERARTNLLRNRG